MSEHPPPKIHGVRLNPEFPGVIDVETIDGTRWHYLPDSQGNLEIGRPVITHVAGPPAYKVTWFAPLAPYSFPRVISVEVQP